MIGPILLATAVDSFLLTVAFAAFRAVHHHQKRDDWQNFTPASPFYPQLPVGSKFIPFPYGAETSTPLLTRQSDTPIKAYKVARLMRFNHEQLTANTHWSLFGVYQISPYPASGAEAFCYRFLHSHGAPQPDCTCGFYAVKEIVDLRSICQPAPDLRTVGVDSSRVLCEVELSGRVIAHERGYRAQHMETLRVTLLDPVSEELLREIRNDLQTEVIR